MRKVRNIQFSSAETDRKVMLVISGIFMTLAWVAVAAGLVFGLIQKLQPDGGAWSAYEVALVCVLASILVVIPIQLARYYREWHTL